MSDVKGKCEYKPNCPWSYNNVCNSPNDHGYDECDYDRGILPYGYRHESENRIETNGDTISRQVAIDAMYNLCDKFSEPNYCCENPHIDVIVNELENLPSVQLEVIHCKDCKHRDYWGSCKKLNSVFNGHKTVTFDDNFYCGFAEGKEADG